MRIERSALQAGEAMFKQIAGAAILGILFIITTAAQPSIKPAGNSLANGKPETLVPGAEAARAIARFGDLSPAAIRECLKEICRPTNRPAPELVNKILESQNLAIVSSKRIGQLKAALQPVLEYHGRGQMPIYILWSDQPKAYLVERAVILITNRLVISASDEEIRGIVAHELAHEYVWDEHARAREAKNGKLMRECELFCDVVAAFTL